MSVYVPQVVNSESQDQLEYEAVQGVVQETIGRQQVIIGRS